MAIAFVKSVFTQTNGGANASLTLNSVAAGNKLVALIANWQEGSADQSAFIPSSIVSSPATTWTLAKSGTFGRTGAAAAQQTSIWIADAPSSANYSVTVNNSFSEAYNQIVVAEYSGVQSGVAAIDQSAVSGGNNLATAINPTVGPSAPTTQQNELVLAIYGASTATANSNTGIDACTQGYTNLLTVQDAISICAISADYKIVNSTGTQSAAWGTTSGETGGWSAALVTLKSATENLSVNGTTFNASTSLIAGTPNAVRRATFSGQVFSRAASLIASTGVGGTSVVAYMATTYTADSTGQPTSDVSDGYTADGTNIFSNGILAASAGFLPGGAIGVPINISGGASLSASSAFISGSPVGQRRATQSASLYVANSNFVAGSTTASRRATPVGAIFAATSSLTVGQSGAFNNAAPDGVLFTTSTSMASQSNIFTFDSTAQPTFDKDNGYSFDSGSVAASQSAIPNGVVSVRQASFVAGAAQSRQAGLSGNNTFVANANFVSATVSVVAAGAIPGAVLTATPSLVLGQAFSQRTISVSGFVSAAQASIVVGNSTSTTAAQAVGFVLPVNASLLPGSTNSQISRGVNGVVVSSAATLIAGVSGSTASTTTPLTTLPAGGIIVSGAASSSRNANTNSQILAAQSQISVGSASSLQGTLIGGYAFGSFASFNSGNTTATKSAVVVGKVLTGAALFAGGGINGLLNGTTNSQSLTAAISYFPASANSIQLARHPGQPFLIQSQLLAGQTVSAVNANVAGQTLNASTSIQAAGVVEFAAVVILSQTIAAQSAFIAGTAVGKKLTRRNTEGRGFYFLQEFLQPIVGQSIIFSDQNGPRPTKPYATLSVRSISEQEIIQHNLNSDGIVSLAKLQRMIVEVEYFGLGAFGNAQTLGLRIQAPSQVDRAETFGLSVSQIRSITRVPALLNQSQYEERAILEFTAYIMVEGDDYVGLIEHAIIQDTDANHACSFDFVYEGHS